MERPTLKSPRELEYMREAGQIVASTHDALIEATRPGISTRELDRISQETIRRHGGTSNFLNYHGFPATVCISVNNEVVHGIPGERTLEAGDIVSYDCGAFVVREGQQWHGDGAVTVIVGDPYRRDGEPVPTSAVTIGDLPPSVVKRRRELSEITRHSLWAGIAAAARGTRLSHVSAAIEDDVDASAEAVERTQGWVPEIIEGYTGHGIGNRMHEAPTVYNYRTRGRGTKIVPGMAVCIEPMVIAGDSASRVLDDDWTVVTIAGTDAAHWEHTVAFGREGISVLTARDAGAAGLASYGITPIREFAN